MQLKKILEENESREGKYFDIIIQILIIISLISFSYETLPNLSEIEINILKYLESIIVIIFSIEYILRIYVSDNKLRFVFSFYGIIDLLAILPFFMATGLDLRSLRIFRLFRLLRTLKIIRYNSALRRMVEALKLIKNELVLFLILTFFILFIASAGIHYFESTVQPENFNSVFHCFWWAIVTLTTVGYGDVYPITLGGKIFTSIILILGLGIVAVPTGLFASALSRTVDKKDN